MKLVLIIILIASVTCLFMCHTQKTPMSSEGTRIYFGSGGGFTGFVNEYCLLNDGSLFSKKQNTTEWVFHSKLEKRITQQYFEQVEEFDLFNIEFNRPANRYFFIQVKERKRENKITWGDSSIKPMKEISVFYNILNQHIIKKNTKN